MTTRRRQHVIATRRMVAELATTLVNVEEQLPADVTPEFRKKFDANNDAMWKIIEDAVKKYGLL